MKRMPLLGLLGLALLAVAGCSDKKQDYKDTIGPPGPGGRSSAPSSSADQARFGDTVWVEYTGKLTDGTVFDSNAGKEPMRFVLGVDGMIVGFTAAVTGMRVGESKTVTIPPEEGYGPAGSPPKIPPNATLIFDIKLVRLQKR